MYIYIYIYMYIYIYNWFRRPGRGGVREELSPEPRRRSPPSRDLTSPAAGTPAQSVSGSSHRMHLFFGFVNSTPSQNCRLIAYYHQLNHCLLLLTRISQPSRGLTSPAAGTPGARVVHLGRSTCQSISCRVMSQLGFWTVE